MSKQDCSFVPYTFSETGRHGCYQARLWRRVFEGQNYNPGVDEQAIFFGAAA